jgi:hypothetical protein
MRMELIGRHAHASGGARPNGHDDQARFARVVLPNLADAYALARWLTGNASPGQAQRKSVVALRVIEVGKPEPMPRRNIEYSNFWKPGFALVGDTGLPRDACR